MMKSWLTRRPRSLSSKLIVNFFVSTLLPFAVITQIATAVYGDQYTKDTNQLVDNTLTSISLNISTYLNELEQLTLTPYYDSDFIYLLHTKKNSGDRYTEPLGDLPIERTLDYMMSFIRNSRTDILSTIIVSEDSPLYYSTNSPQSSIAIDYPYSQQSWYSKAIQADGRAVLIGPHDQDYFIPSTNKQIFSVARSIVDLKTRNNIGLMKVDVNTIVFNNIFQNLYFNVPSKIILLDAPGNLIYSNAEIDESALKRIAAGNETVQQNGLTWNVLSKQVMPYEWNVYVLLDAKALNSKTSWIYLVSILLYISGCICALFFYLFLNQRIVKSVKQLKAVMAQVRRGNFASRYKAKHDDEITVLGEAFNHMTEQLEDKIQKEYVMALKQRNSEYKALQAQMQPHFLFNTLNGFIGLNQIGESALLEKSMYQLSSMLRYVLIDTDLVPLSREMQFISDYCDLQKLRFDDKLNFTIEYEEEASDWLVPKLILQPLVENAILHGIEPLSRSCQLTVWAGSMIRDGITYLQIVIEDDGKGFDMQADYSNRIGLENTKDRLLLFNADSKFHLESRVGSGVKITIELPERGAS